METGRIALVFFYGIFWASVINAISRLRPFETAAIFSKKPKKAEGKWPAVRAQRAWWRCFAAFIFINLLPILWLLFLYNKVIPNTSDVSSVIAAAFASFSVFGFNRILYSIIATKWHSTFFSNEEWKEIKEEWPWKADEEGDLCVDRFAAHFIPGIIYLILFLDLALITINYF